MNEDDFWDLIYDSEYLAVREIGYRNRWDAHLDDCIPCEAIISKFFYEGKEYYATWISEECSFLDDVMVYETESEARQNFQNIEDFEKSGKEIIHDLHEALPDFNFWVDENTNGCYTTAFDLKLERNLILEKYRDLSVEDIKQAVEEYRKFKQHLEERQIIIDSIWKRREFPGNQRYYVFSLYHRGQITDYEAHIPSVQQGQPRKVLDYFREEWIKDFE